MANSNLKLIYFEFGGRAELTRLLLYAAGKKFEDKRLTREEWAKVKPTAPFGQIPILEIDGKPFAQSLAMANFVAREFGFYGKTNLESLQIDQALLLLEDFIQCVVKFFREPDEAKKAEIKAKVVKEDAPKFLGFYEKLLKENGTGYLVGNSLTVADVAIFDMTTGFLKPFVEDHLNNFPAVKALAEKVGSNEKIKAYVASRP